jgi:hypothetical protein
MSFKIKVTIAVFDYGGARQLRVNPWRAVQVPLTRQSTARQIL